MPSVTLIFILWKRERDNVIVVQLCSHGLEVLSNRLYLHLHFFKCFPVKFFEKAFLFCGTFSIFTTIFTYKKLFMKTSATKVYFLHSDVGEFNLFHQSIVIKFSNFCWSRRCRCCPARHAHAFPIRNC